LMRFVPHRILRGLRGLGHHLEVNRAPSDPEHERYRRLAADQYRNVIRSYPGSREGDAARAGLRRLGFPD